MNIFELINKKYFSFNNIPIQIITGIGICTYLSINNKFITYKINNIETKIKNINMEIDEMKRCLKMFHNSIIFLKNQQYKKTIVERTIKYNDEITHETENKTLMENNIEKSENNNFYDEKNMKIIEDNNIDEQIYEYISLLDTKNIYVEENAKFFNIISYFFT